MRNLLDEDARRFLLARLGRLTPDRPARWGRMTARQMVCHVADPLRIALGELEVPDASNLLTRTVLRWMVLAGVPAPRGKVKTYPEIDQVAGGGTPPQEFEADVDALRDLVARFVARAASGGHLVPSPAFGALSPRAYGRLMYLHLDHHLDQFGV